jgi:hypothetical protein
MPDWKQIVRKNLRVLEVCSPEFTEELAGHLEDSYEASLRGGVAPGAAFHRTVVQINRRSQICLTLRILQEDFMTDFARRVGLPGLLTSAATCFFYWALELDHIRHKVIWLVGGQLPLWWWGLLPICGVLGALLSCRNGGSRLQRIAASLLPSATLCALVLLIFVVGFTTSGFVNHYQVVSARLESLGVVPPGFGLIPAAFSLLGAGIAEVSTRKVRRPA